MRPQSIENSVRSFGVEPFQPDRTKHRVFIVVKFNEQGGAKLTKEFYNKDAAEFLEKMDYLPWSTLSGNPDFAGIRLTPLYDSVSPDVIERLVSEARERDPEHPLPNYFSFFRVVVPKRIEPQMVADAIKKSSDRVELAYVDEPLESPSSTQPSAPSAPSGSSQRYLEPGPVGIGASAVRAAAGGTGGGQEFIDFEQGWTFAHQDLQLPQGTLLHGLLNDQDRPHGTAVLGLVLSRHNTTPIRGIAPGIQPAHTVSYLRTAAELDPDGADDGVDYSDPANALMFATASLTAAIDSTHSGLSMGGVLLLEAQTSGNNYPVEYYPANFAVIRLAVNLDIAVVEAAGNGNKNLDTLPYPPDFPPVLSPNRAGYQDSGAILVAAAQVNSHARMPHSNYGSRINCYAWGENIDTLSSDTTDSGASTTMTMPNFDGTSGAAAIIAGAVLVLQGITQAQSPTNARMRASPLRQRLSSSATGTGSPSNNATPVEHIGFMPDLGAIFPVV